MLLVYNLFLIHLIFSLSCVIKDIFLKDVCIKIYNDSDLIDNIKETRSLWISNTKQLLKITLYMDVYFYIFGSNYNILRMLLYCVFGIPVLFLVNAVILRNNTYRNSRNSYNDHKNIKTTNPLFIVLCDNIVINGFINNILVQWLIFGINEYVMFIFLYVGYIALILPELNIDWCKFRDNCNKFYALNNYTNDDSETIINEKWLKQQFAYFNNKYSNYETKIINNYNILIDNLNKFNESLPEKYRFININISQEENNLGEKAYDKLSELHKQKLSPVLEEIEDLCEENKKNQ